MTTRIPSRSPYGGPIAAKKPLFDDDSSSEEDHEDASAGPTKLKINEEYAKRFEHNKKREELHRLEEKYKSKSLPGTGEGDEDEEGDSSEDETEDEGAFLVTDELDAEISATLRAIKNKDPRIYDKDAVFYKPSDAEAESVVKEKKEKPVFLRDYHRERYMRGDVGADAEEPEEQERPRTYVQEQDDLKQAILSEIKAKLGDKDSESEDEDAFVQRKEADVGFENGVHPTRAAAIKLTELDVARADENPEEYLSKFMASRAWIPEDGPNWQAFESDEGENDDLDLAEEFEHAYNMRFEDPEKSNEVLKSYSRDAVTARSVRREDLRGRKKQRLLEKDKKEAEKKERQEERARLRRLKVEEAAEKLQKIKQAAGLSGKALDDVDWMKFLDDAWENDKWEGEMRRKFGEEYYAEADDMSEADDDEGPNADDGGKRRKKPKKPRWDDDIDIKDIIPDFEDATRPDITITDSEQESEDEDEAEARGTSQAQRKRKASHDDYEEGSESDRPAKKRKSAKDKRRDRAETKRQARRELSKIEALVDVKMNLDDPTVLANSSKTSGPAPVFRYRETSPNTFGMTARDILLAPSDAALNQFAGLKKLAAFRDADKKRKDKKRLGKKARLRQWRREIFGAEFERTGPTYGFAEAGRDEGATPAGGAPAKHNADDGVAREAKTKKRKRSKGKKPVTAAAEE